MKLSRLFPNSLAMRTVLLVVAAVVIAEYATFSLLMGHRRLEHISQTAQLVAGQIRTLQALLPDIDDERRMRLEASDLGERGLQLRPDSGAVPSHSPEFGFATRLPMELEQLLGEPVVVRDTDQQHRSSLWIGFMAGGERWWLVLPPPHFEPRRIPYDLWFWLALSLGAMILFSGLFVLSIVRPLARLADVVSATGDGRMHLAILEGPKEVQRLAECHNMMVMRLAMADAERREMLAGLTHDLRAPLTRLRVRLALLEEDEATYSGLMRDTEDMERIVGQCLAFLRSGSNVTKPSEPLPFADAVSGEVARHREMGRPVELAVQEAAASSKVFIDHGSLQRLLDNLIDNALQYGVPPVEVSVSSDRPESVTLRVFDHGKGIAPQERTRALEAFAQLEPARATRGSCGLGLAIVRRIVDACDAEMTLADADGGGFEVSITFPAQA